MADVTADFVKEIERLSLTGAPVDEISVAAGKAAEGERVFIRRSTHTVLEDVTDKLLSSLPNPRHRAGVVSLDAIPSLIDYVNRMKEPSSVLFASADALTLTAVFDYHEPVNEVVVTSEGETPTSEAQPHTTALPRWGRFKAVFKFPKSPQYVTWSGQNKKTMSQADLASFLEDNILDVQPESMLQEGPMKKLTEQLGLKLGSPEDLLQVARGFTLKAAETFSAAHNLDTGETQIIFAQEHNVAGATKSNDIKVPTAFMIAVPVFEGDARYPLLVRLKYRKAQSSVVWFFDIYNLDKAFKHAFELACSAVQAAVDLPLFYGQ